MDGWMFSKQARRRQHKSSVCINMMMMRILKNFLQVEEGRIFFISVIAKSTKKYSERAAVKELLSDYETEIVSL